MQLSGDNQRYSGGTGPWVDRRGCGVQVGYRTIRLRALSLHDCSARGVIRGDPVAAFIVFINGNSCNLMADRALDKQSSLAARPPILI